LWNPGPRWLMVRILGLPDRGFESGELHAILTELAVHMRVPMHGFLGAL
jgi:hypothetical protein